MRLLFSLAVAVGLLCAQTPAAQPFQAPAEALVKGTPGLRSAGIAPIPSLRALSPSARLDSSAGPMATAQSFSNYEWWNTVTIPAGGAISLDSGINYTASDTVRVTFRSAASDIGNLVAAASWSVPEIDHFNIQDVSLGSNYFLPNSGGAVFSVSGTQFRLILANTGAVAISLNSVLIIAREQ